MSILRTITQDGLTRPHFRGHLHFLLTPSLLLMFPFVGKSKILPFFMIWLSYLASGLLHCINFSDTITTIVNCLDVFAINLHFYGSILLFCKDRGLISKLLMLTFLGTAVSFASGHQEASRIFVGMNFIYAIYHSVYVHKQYCIIYPYILSGFGFVAYLFGRHIPLLNNEIFGYHELFHIFIASADLLTLLNVPSSVHPLSFNTHIHV